MLLASSEVRVHVYKHISLSTTSTHWGPVYMMISSTLYRLPMLFHTHLVGMGSVHVLRAVRSIGEGLATPFILAHVRPFASMGTKMSLQIFQTRVGLVAALVLCVSEWCVMKGLINLAS